jgi:hypothetical protein
MLTPSSQIKLPTLSLLISNRDGACPTSFSNVGDVMLTSSSQNEGIHVNYSTPPNKDPPECKITAVIAVMRGKPKDDYNHHHSNKHYKQNHGDTCKVQYYH